MARPRGQRDASSRRRDASCDRPDGLLDKNPVLGLPAGRLSRIEQMRMRRRAQRLGMCRPPLETYTALLYSISSSARPDSGSDTLIPSAFAELRLMISSSFVDCCTGRSAGLSPFKIRPV
jgi:hypothetical protein